MSAYVSFSVRILPSFSPNCLYSKKKQSLRTFCGRPSRCVFPRQGTPGLCVKAHWSNPGSLLSLPATCVVSFFIYLSADPSLERFRAIPSTRVAVVVAVCVVIIWQNTPPSWRAPNCFRAASHIHKHTYTVTLVAWAKGDTAAHVHVHGVCIWGPSPMPARCPLFPKSVRQHFVP